jgi:hypothetical protein
VHASAPPSLEAPGVTGIARSNDCLTSAMGVLTLPLLGFFPTGLCLASVGLLMLPCVCRLMVEWEANRSAGHPVAGSSERRPADERHSSLQHPQAGLQAPHVQAQLQVQSLICVSASTTPFVQLVPPDLCQYNSECLQLHHVCIIQCNGG